MKDTIYKNKSLRNAQLLSDWQCAVDCDRHDGRTRCKGEILRQVLTECRPSYDVSYDYALEMMRRMLRDGKACPARSDAKRQMWHEIAESVRAVVAERHMTIADAVAYVLSERRASRYFLTVKQAYKIIRYETERHRRLHAARG